VVVGDALLDRDVLGTARRLAPGTAAPVVEVADERLRPGGAALAAVLAARHGRETVLVTALGAAEDTEAGEAAEADADPGSAAVRRLLAERPRPVRVRALPLRGALAVKTRVLAGNVPVVRMDLGDGAPQAPDEPTARELAELFEGAGAVLVADYGRGTVRQLRELLARAASRHTPVLWDPHPRGATPVPGCRLVTPDRAEAATLAEGLRAADAPRGDGLRAVAADAAALLRTWQAAAAAVTLGERGALLLRGPESPMLVPSHLRVPGGDACGAGDAFAAAAAAGLADGDLVEEAVQRGVEAAGAYVAAGGAASWDADAPARAGGRPGASGSAASAAGETPHDPADALALAEAVRARGGTVVAAGGCFDILHAGHVALLEDARRIGDCLVVCLNSDASARRLKGAGRPVNPVADRVRVLRGLGCVDAVAVFDEDTPVPLLRRLRPDVWVKGGDYLDRELPEAEVLAGWGGQAVMLPYLQGRSTTAIARRAGSGSRR